jgi:hypothetical protein
MLHKKIKKTIFTLNVDNYAPEITELTYPLIKRYAEKIGADLYTIMERKHPNLPPVYEKMQIYELAQEMENDWNIYIDSDALVHPDMFDITEFLPRDTVCHNGNDMANNRWKYDNYFRRDGRNIGSCNWLAVASDWCIDLWHPLDIPYTEALKNIFPIQNELNTVITPSHLIDDYALSRNISRFGLKFKTVMQIANEIRDGGNYLYHQYTLSTDEKVKEMRRVLANWNVCEYKDPNIDGPWMTYNELIWLYLTAQKADSVVHVGSAWKGKAPHALASACKGTVHLVDAFKDNPKEYPNLEKELRGNMAQFKNVEFIEENSIKAAKKFKDKSIDMVFIDGSIDREFIHKNIEVWYPKCKKLICGHDFGQDTVKMGIFDSNRIPRLEVGSVWSVEATKDNI